MVSRLPVDDLSSLAPQLVLDPWSAAVCRSPGYGPLSPGYSPLSPGEESPPDLAPGPDWRPGPALRRPARRPRPYDKPGQPGRRLAMTEEQRRLRKKEQNKNAATRSVGTGRRQAGLGVGVLMVQGGPPANLAR